MVKYKRINQNLIGRSTTNQRGVFTSQRLLGYHEPIIKSPALSTTTSEQNRVNPVGKVGETKVIRENKSFVCDLGNSDKSSKSPVSATYVDMNRGKICCPKKNTCKAQKRLVQAKRYSRKRYSTIMPSTKSLSKAKRPRIPLCLTRHTDIRVEVDECAEWEKIEEETLEELEECENTTYCTEDDILEALSGSDDDPKNQIDEKKETKTNSKILNIFTKKKGKEELTRYDFLPVQNAPVSSTPPQPVQLPTKFEFTESDREEFRQLFAEESKVLMPRLRNKRTKACENIPPCEKYQKKYSIEQEVLVHGNIQEAETSFTIKNTLMEQEVDDTSPVLCNAPQVLPAVEESPNFSPPAENFTNIEMPEMPEMPVDTTPPALPENLCHGRTYFIYFYVSILLFASVSIIGYMISNFVLNLTRE